jgi:hypothetical protein
MATPPKHLRVLRPFVLGALLAGTGGSLLGYVLLERSQWSLSGSAWPLSQVHGQLQLFGFLLPFITGFAFFLVPRLSGGQPVALRGAAWASLSAFGAGLLLTAWVPFTHGALAVWVRELDALAVLVATTCAALALHGPVVRFAATIGGRRNAGYLWFFELSLVALFLAGIADAVGLWRSNGSPLPILDEPWARAAWRLALEGFGVGMALGVAARMFTGFLGIAPDRAYPAPHSAYRRDSATARNFWIWVASWAASVALTSVGELLAAPHLIQSGELLFAVGAIPLALRLGLAPVAGRLAIDRGQDPLFPIGARAAFAVLALASVLGAAGAACALFGLRVSPAWIDVRRHLLALGFLMTLIATMAGRLASGFARRPFAGRWLRTLAMVAFPLAAILRLGEGIASQWGLAAWLKVSAASGPVALIAFAALFAGLGATLVQARNAG